MTKSVLSVEQIEGFDTLLLFECNGDFDQMINI